MGFAFVRKECGFTRLNSGLRTIFDIGLCHGKKTKTTPKSKIDPGMKAILAREPGLKTTLEQIDKTFGDARSCLWGHLKN